MPLEIIQDFEPREICSACPMKALGQKSCCESMPGIYHPADFGEGMVEKIASLLASGKASVDYWDGDLLGMENPMWVRPATKTSRGIVDPSWGGECVNLGVEGCGLEFSDRPAGCRNLKPHGLGYCEAPEYGDNETAAEAWAPFQGQIENAIDRAAAQMKAAWDARRACDKARR